MATTKKEFQDLASDLIDDEFADFRRPLSFSISTGGTYSPFTETTTGATVSNYNYLAIPQPIDISEWQGLDIAATDVLVVYKRVDSFTPSVEQACNYDGKQMQVRQSLYDAADATVKLLLRAL